MGDRSMEPVERESTAGESLTIRAPACYLAAHRDMPDRNRRAASNLSLSHVPQRQSPHKYSTMPSPPCVLYYSN